MSWNQKIIILFITSTISGIAPALAVAYANHLFDPGVCWPDIYGGSLLIPVGMVCLIWGSLSISWMERKLNVCGHAQIK